LLQKQPFLRFNKFDTGLGFWIGLPPFFVENSLENHSITLFDDNWLQLMG
jgi:hypothetical protein